MSRIAIGFACARAPVRTRISYGSTTICPAPDVCVAHVPFNGTLASPNCISSDRAYVLIGRIRLHGVHEIKALQCIIITAINTQNKLHVTQGTISVYSPDGMSLERERERVV